MGKRSTGINVSCVGRQGIGKRNAPKGPCTHIVYTLVPKYIYRDYCKAKVYTIWVHGPLGCSSHAGEIIRGLTAKAGKSKP